MVFGCHIATCLHCHKQWMVGDCIPDICQECVAKGHRGWPFGDNLDRDEWAMAHSNTVMPAATHFARNRAMVAACDALIAIPPCEPMPTKGGTAYTAGVARKARKAVYVIWPSGREEMIS